MPTTVKSKKLVKATPAQVYFAFTHAIALTEWLCDFATVAPRPGGRMYLWWHGDYYSAGEYLALEENKSIRFQWFGRGEPAPSQVAVTLMEKDDGTLVTMAHTVLDGEDWEQRAKGFKQEWDFTLDNLAQVLETGLDKRAFDRPMLGINISDFNAEIAKSMGVPVTQGIRLDFLPEAMGAYKAGLRQDDVLVELGGKPISNDYGSLVLALQGKHGGDKVEVIFYRGPQKMTITMELTKRSVPQIPWDAAGLAKAVRVKYNEGLAALEKAFAGVGEAAADFEPAPGEWSAKQVLAHLIHTERHWLENLDDVVGGFPRLSDEWAGNSTVHARATAVAYKNIRDLLDEMNRLSDEMTAYVTALPLEFVARKASYFQAANMLLEGSLPHILSHINQIQSAIASVNKS